MEMILRNLARLTPRKLLACFWLAAMALTVVASVRLLQGVVYAVLLLMYVGYPYALILGMPQGIVRPALRRWSRPWFAILLGAAALMAIVVPFATDSDNVTSLPPTTLEHWLGAVVALVWSVAVFTPFFAGAAALNDTRAALRQPATLDSIPNFLALYFWPAGGILHVHQQVREVLGAVPRVAGA